MLPKDFAVGLRLEHPQELIDQIQYHNPQGRGDFLPAAEYSFVTNVDGRGVYSFCMCPGGVVVPACTGPEQQVVNGMSASGRNTAWANSAMVTSIGKSELTGMRYKGLFAGLEFQEDLERASWEQGGKNLYAPAQRLTHFLRGHLSENLPKSSYKPGIRATSFQEWLPKSFTSVFVEGWSSSGKGPGVCYGGCLLLGCEESYFFSIEDSERNRKDDASGNYRVVSLWRRSRICWGNCLGRDGWRRLCRGYLLRNKKGTDRL